MYPVVSPTQLVGVIQKVGTSDGSIVKLYPHNPAPAINLEEFFSMWQGRNVTIMIEENDKTFVDR